MKSRALQAFLTALLLAALPVAVSACASTESGPTLTPSPTQAPTPTPESAPPDEDREIVTLPPPIISPGVRSSALPPGAVARFGLGINTGTLDPTGEFLAVGATDGLHVFYAETLEEVWSLATEASVTELAWSPDGTMLALVLDELRIVAIVDVTLRTERYRIAHEAVVGGIAWSPDSTQLAVGWGGDGWYPRWNNGDTYGRTSPSVTIWDASNGHEVMTMPVSCEFELCPGSIQAVIWSPDGRTIVAIRWGGYDDEVIAWDTDTRSISFVAPIEYGSYLYEHLLPHPDASIVAVYTGDQGPHAGFGTGVVLLLDGETGDRVGLLDTLQSVVTGAAWSPDGSRIAVASLYNDDESGRVTIFDALSGETLQVLEFQSGQPGPVTWSPDRRWLVASSQQHFAEHGSNVSIWDAASGQLAHGFHLDTNMPSIFLWPSDSAAFISLSRNAILRIDAHSGRIEAEVLGTNPWSIRGPGFTSISWSPNPDLALLAAGFGRGDGARVWDVRTGSLRFVIPGSHDNVSWSPDGNLLAALGREDVLEDGEFHHEQARVSIVDAEGNLRNTWIARQLLRDLDWSPDGMMLSTLLDDTEPLVDLWDPGDGELLQELEVPIPDVMSDIYSRRMEEVTWSPDGTQMAVTTSHPFAVAVLDPASGESRWIEYFPDVIGAVAWSPDGRYLAVGYNRGTFEEAPPDYNGTGYNGWVDSVITIWDMTTHTQIATLRGHPLEVLTLAWSPDGRYLASGGGNTDNIYPYVIPWELNAVILWDTHTWQEVRRLMGHNNAVFSLAWSPDSSLLASGSQDDTVLVWEITP